MKSNNQKHITMVERVDRLVNRKLILILPDSKLFS